MKNMRKLHVPQAVRTSAEQAPSNHTVIGLPDMSKAEHLPLEKVSTMYAQLAAFRGHYRPDLEKGPPGHDTYLAAGGTDGLRWARRELRQAGMLKALDEGDVSIPESLDFLFGPDVYAVASRLGVAKVADAFADASIPAAIAPTADGSLALFAANVSTHLHKGMQVVHDVDVGKSWDVEESKFPDASWGDSVVVTEPGTKAGTNGQSMFKCYAIPETFALAGITFDKTYLLRTGDQYTYEADVVKVDEEHGIVLGWGMVCKIKDKEYYDTQDDHITEPCMFGAAVDYMEKSRQMGDMHARTRDATGRVVPVVKGTTLFAMPLTTDVKKALGIECDITGLAIGVKPDDPAIVTKFRTGEYTGFSIGGKYIPEFIEEVD